MDLLAKCPMLIPQNSDRTRYDGFVTVSGQDYRISITLRQAEKLRGAEIDCEWRLKHLLKSCLPVIRQRLHQSTDLASFLIELQSIIQQQQQQQQLSTRHVGQTPPPPQYYSLLTEQLNQLGWHRLCYISETFDELHLSAVDGKKRTHCLRLHLHSQHPDEAPEFLSELPRPFRLTWSPRTELCGVLSSFERCLEQYQLLWDTLDELDANTCILEPEKPNRAATHRRIALGPTSSLLIEVDPDQPQLLPHCRFLSAEHIAGPLKENLNKNLAKWIPGHSLLYNLQSVLEVDFPSATKSSKQDVSMACSICYAYRLNGELPDQACENPRCQHPFHRCCLYEWLRGVPSSRHSFNVLFGECPYCNQPVTVKMPT